MTFDRWIREVDRILIDFTGLGSEDLSDVDYEYLWSCGCQPGEAAQVALNNEWGEHAPELPE